MGYIVAVILVILSFCFYANNQEFNRWTQDCNQAGGRISETHKGVFSTRYECFVDGKMVTLPGWGGK